MSAHAIVSLTKESKMSKSNPWRSAVRLLLPGVLALSAINLAAAAPVTFAQYVQQDGAEQQWTITSTATTTTVSATGSVFLSFSGVTGLPFAGPESAMFTLTATSNVAGNCGVNCGPGDSFVQPGYAGTFSFIDTGAAPGANLLSGTFAVTGSPSTTGAQFSSSIGATGAGFDASATAGNLLQLVMTSDYLVFTAETQQNASWSMSSLIPNFSTGTVLLTQARPGSGPYGASGTGTFSSNPGPSSVPEPASLLLLGIGMTALGVLRRRS